MVKRFSWLAVAAAGLILVGCSPAVNQEADGPADFITAAPQVAVLAAPAVDMAPPVTELPDMTPAQPAPGQPATVTPIPTQTPRPPTATPTLTNTPRPTPTATPTGPCSERIPAADDLFTVVTLEYALSRQYAPADLVPLSDYLPITVTLGYPTELRQVAVGPLVKMIEAMWQAGLQPYIISGYRSYSAQAIAWNKWLVNEPERASIISAPPGHSEHQLGTTVDFGSPELAEIVGQEDIEFHTYFFMTGEGQWLLEHAHEYGFTLSYPREAFDLTGFYYEPWHYRYVGPGMATQLREAGLTLTQFLLDSLPPPCIP
jgi:zinc D-Ala-D-Ala carboxypeptidase